MVRDPCHRFTENAPFVTLAEKQEVLLSPMGKTNHGTQKTYQATVEQSDVRATLAQHFTLQVASTWKNANIVRQVKSCFQHFQCVFAYQQH